MRKCTFKLWIRQTGYTQQIDGTFHCFGKENTEYEGGIAERTIAIVEDCEGQLHKAEIETIIFKKPTK